MPLGHIPNSAVTLGQRGSGVCSHAVLTDVLIPAWKRTNDADKLKGATEALEADAPGVVERMQAAVGDHEVAWAARYLIEKEELGIDK